MKKLILITLVALWAMLANKQAFSQDLIYLKDDTISAKIIEYGERYLKYQEAEMPIIEIKKRKILRLEYSNGKYEDFGSKNPRKIRPLSIGIVVSDYLEEEMFLAEIGVNYFHRPYLALSTNFGIDVNGTLFITTGPRYYFNKTHSAKRLSPFVGCQIGIVSSVYDLDICLPIVQLPFGLDYVSQNGFNFALELSPRFVTYYKGGLWLIGLRFGKNF
jgi:hypothetical protein